MKKKIKEKKKTKKQFFCAQFAAITQNVQRGFKV